MTKIEPARDELFGAAPKSGVGRASQGDEPELFVAGEFPTGRNYLQQGVLDSIRIEGQKSWEKLTPRQESLEAYLE